MTALLTIAEAAAMLGVSVKTMRGHVKAGEIAYINLGRGEKRARMAFEPCDIDEFLNRRRTRQCQSTSRKVPRSTTSTSRSVGIDFAAVRAKLKGAQPRR